MLRVDHPEVLAPDWLPPTLLGRTFELERLRRLLGDPLPDRPMPWVAGVDGPAGSGTSSTARLAARRLLEAYRRERPGATAPLLVAVRVRWCAGPHGVATALLQSVDDGFSGRGFSVVEIVAGFLRRLSRVGRPAVVVLDDVGPDTPDLAPILRGLLAPLRFLPEGADGAPPIWTIVAGQLDRPGAPGRPPGRRPDDTETVHLPPMDAPGLRAVLADRVARALGRDPPPALLERIAERAAARGLGATRALDLLRRELLGSEAVRPPLTGSAPGVRRELRIEPRVVEALDLAEPRDGGGLRVVRLRDLRECEARLARAEGVRPLPATTLWRRLVQLEAVGLVRRAVRPGGAGGTHSEVELLRPLNEWPLERPGSRTHRADVAVPSWREGVAAAPRPASPSGAPGSPGPRPWPRAPPS